MNTQTTPRLTTFELIELNDLITRTNQGNTIAALQLIQWREKVIMRMGGWKSFQLWIKSECCDQLGDKKALDYTKAMLFAVQVAVSSVAVSSVSA